MVKCGTRIKEKYGNPTPAFLFDESHGHRSLGIIIHRVSEESIMHRSNLATPSIADIWVGLTGRKGGQKRVMAIEQSITLVGKTILRREFQHWNSYVSGICVKKSSTQWIAYIRRHIKPSSCLNHRLIISLVLDMLIVAVPHNWMRI